MDIHDVEEKLVGKRCSEGKHRNCNDFTCRCGCHR